MTQISATPETVAIDQVTISPLAQPRDGRITIDVRLEGDVSPRWRRVFLLRLERGATEFLDRDRQDDPAGRALRVLASSDPYDRQLVHLRGRIDAQDAWAIVREVVYPAIGAAAAGAAHEHPEATVAAAISSEIGRHGGASQFVKTADRAFAIRSRSSR